MTLYRPLERSLERPLQRTKQRCANTREGNTPHRTTQHRTGMEVKNPRGQVAPHRHLRNARVLNGAAGR